MLREIFTYHYYTPRTIHHPPMPSFPRDMQLRGGRLLVFRDKYVILDTTKGTYITDNEGNIIGQNKP